MKYIFILCAFVIVDLCIIIYILYQNLHNLTCTKNYAQHKMGRRERWGSNIPTSNHNGMGNVLPRLLEQHVCTVTNAKIHITHLDNAQKHLLDKTWQCVNLCMKDSILSLLPFNVMLSMY
jgi:hypothetical protein